MPIEKAFDSSIWTSQIKYYLVQGETKFINVSV